jgi:hypothetical protein
MAYKDHAKAIEYWRQYNAKRRKPKVKQAREVAAEQGLTHYFTGAPCMHGHLAERRVKDRVCSECDRIKMAKLRKEQPKLVAEKKKQSYERNKKQHLSQKRSYRQANKGKINALVASRKKHIKQRTPAWLSDFDKLKMQCMYSVAAMLTRENKEPWHVDHIVPLQGKLVSGLHVPSNLQLMRGLDNISKKNKYEVTYA